MLTLDEAIKHCEEKAKELRAEAEHEREYQDNKVAMMSNIKGFENVGVDLNKMNDCLECASEHEQLAEWLTELKAYREWREMMKTVYADSSVLVMVKENDK